MPLTASGTLALARPSLCGLYLWISIKLHTARLFESGPVPELRVEGYVQLSSLDLLSKVHPAFLLIHHMLFPHPWAQKRSIA